MLKCKKENFNFIILSKINHPKTLKGIFFK